MKSVLTLISCPVAVLAASISRGVQAVPAGPFTAGAWRTNDEVFFVGNAINASGGKFYINRNTSTYCPDGVSGLDCSLYSGSQTIFAIGNGTTTMSLDVTVPGGQQIYIAPDGSLSYTQAHSAYIPAGSTITGFSRQQSEAFGAPINLYSTAPYWSLCPVTEGEPRERTYQIFALSDNPVDCYLTQIRTYTPGSDHVWQYA
ncbi:hypothetical protein F4824DRAFT_449926 [Ustulina deusta]|nr:hypothetical protein F4824DRAFT_449926 [Ustulina deusta]